MDFTLYVDMDGVVADIDRHYTEVFGVPSCKKLDVVDWNLVREHRGFYYDIPPMPDLATLWAGIAHLSPTMLTGVPVLVPDAAIDKLAWVRKHLGDVPTICCLSKDKYQHCKPGDILIDDWEKYKDLWIGAGGRWVTHTSATDTLEQLRAIGVTVR